MKHLPVLIFATVLALTACGGGGDSVAVSDAGGYTVESGVAQKGPLARGSAIWVNELAASTYKPNGKEYTFRTNSDFGTFTPNGITYGTPYLSTLAQGYYYNEITGTQSNDIVLLSGLSQIGIVGSTVADTAINVNVLSSMAVNRITKLATTAPILTFTAARAKAQKETLGAFYIYNDASILSGAKVGGVDQPANLTALDLSKSRAADQILAAVSAVVMKAGVNGAGVNALLSQTASDLEDDGLLNNSTNYRTSMQSKLCAAAAVADFATVATNLNSLYGTTYLATDLSQWVDTSGCADQVINKYKFTATSVAVGIESKSPAYIAGPDDVGQCFSVGGVSAGATAKLYYKGNNTAVTATQKVVLGDSLTVGVSASFAGSSSAFIQRSAPSTAGACTATVPSSGLTRVHKYTVTYTIIDVKISNQPHYIRLLNNGLFSISGNNLVNSQTAAGSYVNIYTPQNNIISNIVNPNARSTGGGYIDSIDVTQDGFTYFGSWGELSKLDSSGKVIWKKTIPGADYSYLSVSPDGGVFAAGANNNGQFWGVTNANTITKYDANGNISWNTQLPMKTKLGVFFYGITATPDGGVIATGMGNFTTDGAYTARTGFMAKLNSAGIVVWQKDIVNYANPAIIDAGISNPAIDANGNIIVGIRGTPSVGGFSESNYLTKIDKNGNVIWTKNIGNGVGQVGIAPDGKIIGLAGGGGIGRAPGSVKKYTTDGIFIKDILSNVTDFIIIDPSLILVTGYNAEGAFAKSVNIN